jgi:hypothetical protein
LPLLTSDVVDEKPTFSSTRSSSSPLPQISLPRRYRHREAVRKSDFGIINLQPRRKQNQRIQTHDIRATCIHLLKQL